MLKALGRRLRGGALLALVLAFGAGCVVGQSEPRTCRIGSAIYYEGDVDPGDPCLTCRTDINDQAWTRTPGCGVVDAGPRHDAGPDVPDGSYCTINSVVVPSGASNPDEVCQVCAPDQNPRDWSGVSTGAACDGGYCSAGRCLYGCYISGSVVPPGFDPSRVGRCCNPATSSGDWLPSFSPGSSYSIASHPTQGNIFITDAGALNDVAVLAVAAPFPTWNVFHATGSGQFGNGVTTTIQSKITTIVRGLAGDLNGDSSTDLVIYGDTDRAGPYLETFFGQPTGGFSSTAEYSMGSPAQNGAALVDLRRRRQLDITIGGVLLGVFLNQGDGTFPAERLVTPSGSGQTLMTGDYDGDGFIDIATESAIYFGDGEGRFPTVNSGLGTLVASGDFNGDFLADLVVADPGSVSVYTGTPFRGFMPGIPTPLAHGSPVTATTADFNGDGLLDLLVVTTADNELLLGRGDGTFLPVDSVLGLNAVNQLQAGDLNGDQIPDVAVFEIQGKGSWTPWFNNCP